MVIQKTKNAETGGIDVTVYTTDGKVVGVIKTPIKNEQDVESCLVGDNVYGDAYRKLVSQYSHISRGDYKPPVIEARGSTKNKKNIGTGESLNDLCKDAWEKGCKNTQDVVDYLSSVHYKGKRIKLADSDVARIREYISRIKKNSGIH